MSTPPTISIPLTIPARDEAGRIAACITSLRAAATVAEQRLPVRYDILVVCDRCRDDTESIARALGVDVLRLGPPGGKVEAQRAGVRPGPFQLFCDADVVVRDDSLLALTRALLDDPRVQVAFPPHAPLLPRARTPLARALHVYNLRRGFSSQRSWFSGRCFAIRRFTLPSRAEQAARAAALPPDAFLQLERGLGAEDIYLSRQLIAEHGTEALVETTAGLLLFRAPETLRGMYRYYRRLRIELARADLLFPETRAAHHRFGRRVQDLLPSAPPSERALHALFQAALLVCRAGYVVERAARRALGRSWDPWPAVEETKRP